MFRSALADRTLLVVIENAERAADVRPFLPGDGRSNRAGDGQGPAARSDHPGRGCGAASSAARTGGGRRLLSRSAPGISESQARLITEACGYLRLPLRVAGDALQRGGRRRTAGPRRQPGRGSRSGNSPSIGTILTCRSEPRPAPKPTPLARSRVPGWYSMCTRLCRSRPARGEDAAVAHEPDQDEPITAIGPRATSSIRSSGTGQQSGRGRRAQRGVSRGDPQRLLGTTCGQRRRRRLMLPQRGREPLTTSLRSESPHRARRRPRGSPGLAPA